MNDEFNKDCIGTNILAKYPKVGMNYQPIAIGFTPSAFELIDSSKVEIVSDTYVDHNRVQVSEIQNPFVFPAELSYQVGSGNILAMNANAEPLSTGQAGEHPINSLYLKRNLGNETGYVNCIFKYHPGIRGKLYPIPIPCSQLMKVLCIVQITGLK